MTLRFLPRVAGFSTHKRNSTVLITSSILGPAVEPLGIFTNECRKCSQHQSSSSRKVSVSKRCF